jgi:hypothetical protein
VIHGGHTEDQGLMLQVQLLQEVHSLYNTDRSQLSLSDKQLFNMPKAYRLKQGNDQLLLWTKCTHLTFDIQTDKPPGPQQTHITDWLQAWHPDSDYLNVPSINPSTDDLISAHSDNRLPTMPLQHCGMNSDTQISHLISIDDTDVDSGSSFTQGTGSHAQINKKVIKKNNKVTDGTHQYITPPVTRNC